MKTKEASISNNDEYVFCKEGDFWVIAFGNKELKPLKDMKGFKDIACLIENQGKEVSFKSMPSADTLDTTSGMKNSEAIDQGLTVMKAFEEEAPDSKAKKEYEASYHTLLKDLEEAKSEESHEDIEKIEKGKYGKKLDHESERAINRIKQNINNTIKVIKISHPDLASHFQSRIIKGINCSYNLGKQSTDWKL